MHDKIQDAVELESKLVPMRERIAELEEKLLREAATSFAKGFAEVLVQAACANPSIDASGCNPLNEVVDGKIVPLEAPEE